MITCINFIVWIKFDLNDPFGWLEIKNVTWHKLENNP